MVGRPQPLDEKFAIVDQNGRPTQYFTRWAQQRQIDIRNAVSPAQALAIAQEYVATLQLQEGSGIEITPNGLLPSNPTISADVQAILDQISTVHGSVLFRGATDWQALAPGTTGQFLQTGGAGADPVWATGGGGGGGSTPSIRATSSPIAFNAGSCVVPWPVGTVAGDTVFLFISHGFETSAIPTGWFSFFRDVSTSNVRASIFGKVMTPADISAGSVTINFGGSFNGVIQPVTITSGTLGGVRSLFTIPSGSGATDIPLQNGNVRTSDLILAFVANRAASDNTFSANWTSLQAVNATNMSSALGQYTGTPPVFITDSATATVAGSGYISAVLSLEGP